MLTKYEIDEKDLSNGKIVIDASKIKTTEITIDTLRGQPIFGEPIELTWRPYEVTYTSFASREILGL